MPDICMKTIWRYLINLPMLIIYDHNAYHSKKIESF